MRSHSGAMTRRRWQAAVHAAALFLSAAACARPDGKNSPSSDPGTNPGGGGVPGYEEAGPGVVDIPLTLEELASVARTAEPVRSGVPVPRALDVRDASRLVVVDANGNELATQVAVTSRWGGAPTDDTKPVKWILVDFPASLEAGETAVYRLRTRKSEPERGASMVTESGDAILIDTGAATFTLSKTTLDLFSSVVLADGTELATSAGDAYLTKPDGTRFSASAGTRTVTLEESGPLHAVVLARGKHKAPSGAELLDWTMRVSFYKDRADALVQYTFTEKDLASIRSYVPVDELGITLPIAPGNGAAWTFGGSQTTHTGSLTSAASLRETGGLAENMNKAFNPGKADSIHYALGGDASGSGNHAPGWVDVSGDAGGVSAAVRWFWEQYPKKLAVTPDALTVALWPGEDVDMRVYSASQKTHEVLFTFHGPEADPAAIGREAAARLESPLFARCEPSWYAKSWVWNRIGTADPDDYAPEHQPLVQKYFDDVIGRAFPTTWIERRDDAGGAGHSYSMWDFGDGREHQAWGNNAYDAPRSLLIHYAITGDRAFFDRGVEALVHLRDVDIEHSTQDTRAGIFPARGVPQPWLGRTRYNPADGPQAHDLGFEGRTTYGFEHHKGQSLADHYLLTGDGMSKDVLEETNAYYRQWKIDADTGYLRTGGTRTVSHMLLAQLGYADVFGTAEAKEHRDFAVSYLDEWQRRTTSNDPNGMMWTTSSDSTASFMNGVTGEALMMYEVAFPEGVPVRDSLVDAARWSIDPANGQLENGSSGRYFNAWTNNNYGVAHATVLDPMIVASLGYAAEATGETSFLDISKEVLANSIDLDGSTPVIKAYTQRTRMVPAFLWYLQTPEAKARGGS